MHTKQATHTHLHLSTTYIHTDPSYILPPLQISSELHLHVARYISL